MKRYLITLNCLLFCLLLKSQSLYTCQYWFDENHVQMATATFNDRSWQTELDVGSLSSGIHLLYVQVKDSTGIWCPPQNYMFYKAPIENPVNISNVVYHCWFDQDVEHKQSGLFQTGQFLLDASGLDAGIHMLYVMLEGDGLTAAQNYMFYKTPAESPVNMDDVIYHCWFDQDVEHEQIGSFQTGQFLLDASGLDAGIHMLYVMLEGNGLTAAQNYMFYKKPEKSHIARWEYWVNDDINNRHTTNLSPVADTLEIIALLPVESWPIRSSCFHFHPNGDEPYINAKNEITFRFWDTKCHIFDKSTFYIDENISEPIVADTLERNSTTAIFAPRDNQIHWFKVEANTGDYLSFQADKACTMQLFAPSGEEIYAVSGPESIVIEGFNVWEDGTYYLAVHDVTGSGETVSITYNWLNRYVIVSYDVHVVGNGGRSTITFQGNGFNSLLDAYLVNYQNDTIRQLDIGHESNTMTTISFNFYEENLGVYDAVFEFFEETIRINGALEVQEPVDILLTSTVSYPSRFLRNTLCTYTYSITNNGNMTAYNVPLEIQVYTSDFESLTRVDIGGFNVKSYIREILGSYYSDSLDNVIEQKRLVSGDLFGFFEDYDTDFIPDAPCLHHIIITPTLRPNTTETFTISVSSTTTISVYMWYPDEWENEESRVNLSRTRSGCGNLADFLTSSLCAKNRMYIEQGFDPPYPNVNCDNLPKPNGGCPNFDGGPSTPVNSLDPNDIHGYLSEAGSHYMRQEIQNVQYEIEFENDTTLATAAAHTIIVRDTLNRSRFDLNSLAARSVTIGDKRLDLNGEQTFARTLDLRPELYVIAQVEQDYDPTTGIIQWTIQSLDPMTMEPTNDPNQGVLPVNYYGNGVGFIDYSVNLKHAFPDGTKIRNRAGIIFDQNDVIMTPTWTNIIDAVKPVSYIENVTFEADTLNFSFVSSDNRSGVWYHTLYYRNDSTEMEWKVKVPKIVENSYMLRFNEYQTTEYLVMAVDSAGNHEDKEMVAEYVHYYYGPEPVCQTYTLFTGWNWWSTYLDITLGDLKTALVDALPGTTINIKSQTQNVKYQNGRWAGQLTALDLTRMYMISVENDCEISLVGMPINLSGLTATINNGANWLAFPYSGSMTVTNFFGSFPMSNDQVKSQSQNARYQGGRWGGQLNTLMPGKGYIYNSNTQGTRTFTFPISTK